MRFQILPLPASAVISNASEKYRRLNRRQPQGDELLRPSPTIPKNSHRNSHRHKKTHTKSTRQDTARYDKQSRETVVAQGLCANKIRQEKSRKNKRFIAGSQEVSGSIPLISTRKSSEIVRFQDFFFAFALFDQRYRLASPKASPHPTRMLMPRHQYFSSAASAFVRCMVSLGCWGGA